VNNTVDAGWSWRTISAGQRDSKLNEGALNHNKLTISNLDRENASPVNVYISPDAIAIGPKEPRGRQRW
jgi:hypothetical protein